MLQIISFLRARHQAQASCNPQVQLTENFIKVVVERHTNSQVADIDKHKFLVPNDLTIAQFIWIIRKRIALTEEKALFLFVDNKVPVASSTMGQLYKDCADDDGFLYASYSGENSFGC